MEARSLIPVLDQLTRKRAIKQFLLSQGFEKYGGGCYTVAYSRPDLRYVVKVAKRAYQFPDIDFSDPKIISLFHTPRWMKSDRRICIAPKAFLGYINEEWYVANRSIAIGKRAKRLAIEVEDLGYGNIGRIRGRWKIIDYGCYGGVDTYIS